MSANRVARFVLLALMATAANAHALVIGYFDETRAFGFAGEGIQPGSPPYLSQAKQFLIDQAYTLVSTNLADAAFLSGVDAFYTGLMSYPKEDPVTVCDDSGNCELEFPVARAESQALHDFVTVQGGFLFVQHDHDAGGFVFPANDILQLFGFSGAKGDFVDDGTHTVGTTHWVTEPNV